MEQLYLFMHIVGFILGAGSVTTAYARELYFKWHPEEVSKRGAFPIVTSLVNIGFALIFVSGLGLYFLHTEDWGFPPPLWFGLKMLFVAVLFLNHLFLNLYLRSRRSRFVVLSTISEYVSLLGWYVIIGISLFI